MLLKGYRRMKEVVDGNLNPNGNEPRVRVSEDAKAQAPLLGRTRETGAFSEQFEVLGHRTHGKCGGWPLKANNISTPPARKP
jgi:hypothetical protein